ncbi:MAG TPA: gas vesicle protein GvpD P-loop domain-containing protein [Nitrososphaera sp.]|jgi:KaiC/GvpD/RAD55 family RecA-like ATPase
MAEANESKNETSGDKSLHMPEELMQFIKRDTYSLLVKGDAGTGKTTLALTILKTLGSENNFFYISTRTSPKQLFQYYPWLNDFVAKFKRKNSNVSSEKEVLPSFEDARLDEPESLFERITNQLMDIKSPVIIIDSWDAIASFMDREARLNNERVLQTWRERAGAKLLFISEHPTDSTLDFIVDGIVELKQNYFSDVKVRQIFLLKLRGIRINRPSYIYTLENSLFRSFSPYRSIMFQPHKRTTIDPEIATGERVRSGFRALDAALGNGFPRNGLVLLELDSHMNMTIAMAFLEKIVSNFVSNGNPVLFQPFDWIDLSTIMRFFEPSMPIGKKSLFKVVQTGKTSKVSDNVILLDKNQGSDPLLATILKIKQKHPDKLLLNIMWTDVLQRLYGANEVKSGMKNTLSNMRINTDLSIAIIRYNQVDILDLLTEISDVRLRFMMINETLFLRSLIPSSALYSMVFNDKSELNLEAVV